MQSAIKIAGEILACLPKCRLSPESTENKEGFIHPVNISGQVEQATLDFIIRDRYLFRRANKNISIRYIIDDETQRINIIKELYD